MTTRASQLISILATLFQAPHSCELHAELKRPITRETELTTKCSWLNSLWSCFSNSAFSSGDFCKEFKASSSNSRFRVVLIFSPGSTIPLKGRGEIKRRKKPWLSLRFHLDLIPFNWLLVYYIHLHHTLDTGGTVHLAVKCEHVHPSKPAMD